MFVDDKRAPGAAVPASRRDAREGTPVVPHGMSVRPGATREEVARGLLVELPTLKRYALRLCRNPQQAEDLVQNTLLQALEKAHLWTPGTNLRAWLIALARNRFFSDERARRRTRLEPLDTIADELAIAAPQESWIELHAFSEAFAVLRSEYRELLLAIGLDGELYADTAMRLGLPLGTVRSRLHRARAELRARADPAARDATARDAA
jgi:RNA polymerase sigma-70 factor, ECF subfamily